MATCDGADVKYSIVFLCVLINACTPQMGGDAKQGANRPDGAGIPPDEFQARDGITFRELSIVFAQNDQRKVDVQRLNIDKCALIEELGVRTFAISGDDAGDDAPPLAESNYLGAGFLAASRPEAGTKVEFRSDQPTQSVTANFLAAGGQYFSSVFPQSECRLEVQKSEPIAQLIEPALRGFFRFEATLDCERLGSSLDGTGPFLKFRSVVKCDQGLDIEGSPEKSASWQDPVTGIEWRLLGYEFWGESLKRCQQLGPFVRPTREQVLNARPRLVSTPIHENMEEYQGERRMWIDEEQTTISLDTVSTPTSIDDGGLRLEPHQKSHLVCIRSPG